MHVHVGAYLERPAARVAFTRAEWRPQVRKNTAGAAIKTRDYTLCIESSNKVLELIPGDTKSLYRRALAQWRLGEVDKSCDDLEAILRTKVRACLHTLSGNGQRTGEGCNARSARPRACP